MTENYSASDLKGLTRDAVMYPVRYGSRLKGWSLSSFLSSPCGPLHSDLGMAVATIKEDEIRPVTREDFLRAKEKIKASVTPEVGG